MSDDLRTRIAAILSREIHKDQSDPPCDWCFEFADKFIESLNLTETAGVIVGCNHEGNQ